jgi:plastocyanin
MNIAKYLCACIMLFHVSFAWAETTVEMTDQMKYDPSKVTIKHGDTVVWKNSSSVVHTVTADASVAKNKSHVRLPPGAKKFNSGDIAPGAQYSQRFDVPGKYRYFCIPHEAAGMIGELEVK